MKFTGKLCFFILKHCKLFLKLKKRLFCCLLFNKNGSQLKFFAHIYNLFFLYKINHFFFLEMIQKHLNRLIFLIIFCILLLWFKIEASQVARIVHVDRDGNFNTTGNKYQIMLEDKCNTAKACKPGLILPVWEPSVIFYFLSILKL